MKKLKLKAFTASKAKKFTPVNKNAVNFDTNVATASDWYVLFGDSFALVVQDNDIK